MTLVGNGRVGIGTTGPGYPLHITRKVSASGSSRWYFYNASPASGGSWNSYISLKVDNGYIWSTYGFMTTSDERIKKDIVDVEDGVALDKLRQIRCCSYKYKDEIRNGGRKQIGFLAQQVKEYVPEAVSIDKDILPNIFKKIEYPIWDNTKMSSNDLQDVSGVKYRFYVSNDISDNEEIVELIGDENNCFTFEKEWNNVFCYGYEVNDFHTLDKPKLFALNFSATQEIDKIQQAEKTKLAAAEAEIVTLKNKVTSLETTVADLISRITALESQ